MDRTGIIAVTVCALLLGLWYYESVKYDTYVTQHRALNTNYVATEQSPAPAAPAAAASNAPGFSFSTNVPEHTITLTNHDACYTFTSRGGGIKSVELLDYPETISPRWKKQQATNPITTLNAGAPMPIMAILGDPNLVGDGDFSLAKINGGVEAEKPLSDGLVLTKDFHLSSNYLVDVTVTLKNDSGKPISVAAQQWIIGTALPMDVDDVSFTTYGGAMYFDGISTHYCPPTYFATNTSILGFYPRTPKTQFTGGNGNILWGAAYNQFFVIMTMAKTNQPGQELLATPVDLASLGYQNASQLTGVQAALVFPAQTLAAEQVVQRQVTLFAGPKKFQTLEEISAQFQNRADLVWSFGSGLATFWGVGTFFAKVLLVAMNGLHSLLPKLSYGWIIVLLTLLLRALFWPFMTASIRSMKKMQALAPEIKALKEKYKDDPQKFSQKQIELWRKNKVNPVSGCLPMAVQMPVFIGFYTMIRNAIELRGAHFLWVADLTKTDTLFVIPGVTHIPFFSTPQGLPFNLLPLLMVAVMIWQAHLQPVSPGMDPSQQKMMRYMPLIFLLFFYNYSAGMALYITVSTLVGVLQTRLIKNSSLAASGPAPAPTVSTLTPQKKKKK